jgi:phytanoyl-CoA hydroxylase
MLAREVGPVEIEAAIAHWRVHGWARLPGVASEATLERLRERSEAIVGGRSGVEGLFFQPDSPTGRYEDLVFGHGYEGPDRDYRKIEKLELEPAFRAWLENPLFERILTQAVGPTIRLYRATLFWKAAHRGSDLPYHQDGGQFWGLDRDPALQLWTALDEASAESGCLVVLPGSHAGGLATPLGGVVPPERVLAAEAARRERPLPAEAGDVLLLHNYLWHRSGPNRSASPRRAFTVAYLDGQTRCRRRKRAPREFLPLFGAG